MSRQGITSSEMAVRANQVLAREPRRRGLAGTWRNDTGADVYTADVAMNNGRMSCLGDLSGWSAAREIEADGAIVTPGFIDTRAHDDRAALDTPAIDSRYHRA